MVEELSAKTEELCLHLPVCSACGRCENCGKKIRKGRGPANPPRPEPVPLFVPPRASLRPEIPFRKR